MIAENTRSPVKVPEPKITYDLLRSDVGQNLVSTLKLKQQTQARISQGLTDSPDLAPENLLGTNYRYTPTFDSRTHFLATRKSDLLALNKSCAKKSAHPYERQRIDARESALIQYHQNQSEMIKKPEIRTRDHLFQKRRTK